MDEIRSWLADEFPTLVRRVQEDSGLSRRKFAATIGISGQALAMKMDGDRSFNAAEVIHLCRTHNIEIPGGPQ